MAIVLTNAILVDIDPLRVRTGDLRIDNGKITAGRAASGDEVHDCRGAVVLPGLVNGHTHLYSALAVGMPPAPRNPRNFLEILQLVWWRLDQALDAESIEVSARIGALEALHCGTTTLIDHHASPNAIESSLDWMEKGISSCGVRGVLCYETTDRHGRSGAEKGLAENERYLRQCGQKQSGKFAALAGAHASFTLEDATLSALSAMAARHKSGVHIHVAEDPCDEDACRQMHGISLIDRLDKHGLLTEKTIFAHGTHLDGQAIERVNKSKIFLAHNARSNMNNAVGYSPVGKLRCPVMLGTDGIGADMFAEARTAWFKSRDGHAGLLPADIVAMLANSARRASMALGVTLGKLEAGAAADLVVTDYHPFTPLHTGNLLGHLLFALSARHVRHVLIEGRWALRDRTVVRCDEQKIRADAQKTAAGLWKRMESIN